MHRTKYTQLTKDQIRDRLVSTEPGPDCASPFYEGFNGKSVRVVTDNGPVLDYTFTDDVRLTLSENGSDPIEAGYGALDLKNVILVSHMVPGTMKGYHLMIDNATGLATVIEVWFCGYKDNREVQREIYYGYVEKDGEPVPANRHGLTNKLEGKGFHWVTDTGIETLEFFPSVAYSSFTELTRQQGELTYCGPSDFIKINDNMFIYDRVECEFSGTMTLYVIDLFTVSQIGARLGFDESDSLEYLMFRGTGTIVGQIAQFEQMNDHGEKIHWGGRMDSMTKKGDRPVYRPLSLHPPLTEDQVREVLKKNDQPFQVGEIMPGDNKLELSDYLVGRELTVRYDNGGPAWQYIFDDIQRLRWKEEDAADWNEEIYEAFQPAEDMILFGHIQQKTADKKCHNVVFDFANALTTCVYSKLGTEFQGNEVSQQVMFGVIEMDGLTPPRYWRHSFTQELVGRSYTWNYSETMSSIHVYTTPQSYTWTIFLENGSGGMMWSSPCAYVKLRDDTYLFTWVEEACNGNQGTILFNTRTMHDCGFFYGLNERGLNLASLGAYGRVAGKYDLDGFFGPKQK